jgi:FMN-dependent NADH-azoreductase
MVFFFSLSINKVHSIASSHMSWCPNPKENAMNPVNAIVVKPGATRMLRVDASARHEGSTSRQVGDAIEAAFRQREGATVATRDLATFIVPQLDMPTIGGFFTPPDQLTPELRAATRLSDELIGEMRDADVLLITVPMYNFGIPAALKAWVDQIVRLNATFSYDGTSFGGLVQGKQAHVVVAYGAGGYAPGGPFAAADFAAPYMKFVLNFIGITDVQVHAIESTNSNPADAQAAVARITQAIQAGVAQRESVEAAERDSVEAADAVAV